MAGRCLIHWLDAGIAEGILDRRRAGRVVDLALDHAAGSSALTVLMVSPTRSNQLHRSHFAIGGATDVMTFPDGTRKPGSRRIHLGDLAICPKVARDAAASHGLLPADELILYVLHGLLHLLGHDDRQRSAAIRMWRRQRTLMGEIGVEIGPRPC